MKKLMCLIVVVAMGSYACAALNPNSGFDDGDANWDYLNGPWGGPYFYVEGSDSIVSMGGWGDGIDWSNASIWQNTGAVFEADTEYTLSVVWREPADQAVQSLHLSIQDITADWTTVTEGLVSPTANNEWMTSELMIDTTTNPGLVGNEIGIGVRLTSTSGAWVHIDSIALVPEPVSMAMLGLGSLIALRRRKRA